MIMNTNGWAEFLRELKCFYNEIMKIAMKKQQKQMIL
jgi:hypothetical protein